MSRNTRLAVLVFSLLLAALLMTGVVWRQSGGPQDGPEKQLGIMVEVYEHIANDYVTTPNLAKVSDGGLHGLLSSLDADSSYLDPAEYQSYLNYKNDPPKGNVEAVISKRVGYADVVNVQPGGDAAQAGLVAGDFVEAIQNVGTRDMSLEEIRHRLEGAPGTTITMSVVHLYHSDPVKITITRVAPTEAPLETTETDGVGVITVPDFEAGRTAQIAAAVKKFDAEKVRGIVLDLRDSGAGTYAQAEQTANLFLNHGTITYLEGQRYPRVTTTADPAKAIDTSDPMVVLTNFGTYGPAELAAAALQQNDRAKVVGDGTFGEGSVQKLIPVGDGSAIWLTVARYYSPDGKLIQDGITPNVQQVRYPGALPDMDYPPEGVTGPEPDLQMQKAISMLATPAAVVAKTASAASAQ